MDSKETTILSIALGTWMAWRVMGSSLTPVGSMEIGIAILVLFKPWVGFRGWVSLLTINTISYLPSWFRSWLRISFIYNEGVLEAMRGSGYVSDGFLTDIPMPLTITFVILTGIVYCHFVWPFIVERAYMKAGIWRRLNG